MKTIRIIFAVVILLWSVNSCSKNEVSQRNLVLETASNFEEIVDKELADGKKVYGKYCSVCHGFEGQGDGFNAYNLNPRPRDFTDSNYQAQLDSTFIIETISLGGGAVGRSPLMPAWGRTLTDSDIRNACYYVMYLSRLTPNE